MAAMMLTAVKLLPLKQIDHKFLEPGHTQMEVDSMHSCIERAAKAANIYTPHDWVTVASLAKKLAPRIQLLGWSRSISSISKLFLLKLFTTEAC